MATIDLKLKTYKQLQFEVMNLNTKNYLQQQELDKYKNRIDKAIELIYKAMKERDITGNGTLNLNELLDILQGKGDE